MAVMLLRADKIRKSHGIETVLWDVSFVSNVVAGARTHRPVHRVPSLLILCAFFYELTNHGPRTYCNLTAIISFFIGLWRLGGQGR